MPGSAGSKYGIIDDEVPVKKDKKAPERKPRKELKDIKALITRKAKSKRVAE